MKSINVKTSKASKSQVVRQLINVFQPVNAAEHFISSVLRSYDKQLCYFTPWL
jgi:hypothetical protein